MTDKKELPPPPERENLAGSSMLAKAASRRALTARLRAAKQDAAPQKKKLSWEEWIKRHPLLFLLLWLPASLVLGFAGVETWMTLARMHLFNPFQDWVALGIWIACALWWALCIFAAGIPVWTDWMR
jgi:hypothetical protein